jgi:hypothetical protein
MEKELSKLYIKLMEDNLKIIKIIINEGKRKNQNVRCFSSGDAQRFTECHIAMHRACRSGIKVCARRNEINPKYQANVNKK